MVHYFPAPGGNAEAYCNKPEEYNDVVAHMDKYLSTAAGVDMRTELNATGRVPAAGDVKYIFVTKSGPGPVAQPAEESLLNPATGLPVEPGPKHKRMQISH